MTSDGISGATSDHHERQRRWRMILGPRAQGSLEAAMGECPPLEGEDAAMDDALSEVYDERDEDPSGASREGTDARSAPAVARWLGDVRRLFDKDVVALVQRDAIERKGLRELLVEPETLASVVPSVELVGTLLSLRELVPEGSRAAVRAVVAEVVRALRERMASPLEQGLRGAIQRTRHTRRSKASDVDWRKTVRANLGTWIPSKRTIVPEQVHFHARATQRREWRVIVCMDQSGSMAESVIYASVLGSVLASMPSVATHVVAFDTAVVDLSDRCADPVETLFGVQLGGGTDIDQALRYCEGLVQTPDRTLLVLLSDLYEGGDAARTVETARRLAESGVRHLCLLALSDAGPPSYDEDLARQLRAVGVACLGCTPKRLPDVVAALLRGDDPAKAAALAR